MSDVPQAVEASDVEAQVPSRRVVRDLGQVAACISIANLRRLQRRNYDLEAVDTGSTLVKIVSKFRDYYDFISNRYGADPTCVYMRGKVPGACAITKDWNHKNAHPFDQHERKVDEATIWNVQYIVAGESVFPVLEVRSKSDDPDVSALQGDNCIYRLLDKETFEHIVGNKRRHYDKKITWDNLLSSFETPSFKKAIKAITIKAGVPVFRVTMCNASDCRIEELTPILKDFGIPSACAPEVMWQGIYTTMTSVLRHDPDKAVPVKLANDARVEKAGFDLKTSFRHPVNVKKTRTK